MHSYFVRKTSLPGFYRNTLHWLSYQKYSFEMMMVNDLRGQTFACGTDVSGNPRCAFPTKTAGATRMTGEEILESLDYERVSYSEWAAVLVAMAVIFRLVTYIILKIRR